MGAECPAASVRSSLPGSTSPASLTNTTNTFPFAKNSIPSSDRHQGNATMEAAGLAIGVVGLVAVVDSCKRLMGRIESFQHVGSEARPILVEFSASKHLFDRWLQHVEITEESIQTTSGEKVDEKTAQVIRDLVSCIEDSLRMIEAVISDFRASGPEGAHGGDQPTLKRRPTGFSTKTKFQWAFSKKEKAIKGIQEFYRLIDKLHAVIPVSGPRGDPKQSQSLAPTLPDEFAAHLDKLLERYKVEDRRSITQWLGAKSTESYYEDRLRESQDGTCSWIFDRPDFVSWVSSDFADNSAKLLWLHAPAGFGKTTICAKIVESLRTTTPATTALYFFSERESDTYAIFRSWISQAAYQHDGILEIVANNSRLTSTPMATHSDLERIFRSIAESALEFTFVIDGLDECEDSRGHPADFTETNRHQFVMKLRELISGTRTRVMVVSRPFLDILSAVHPSESEHGLIVYEIPMTQNDVGDDLKAFSRAIVDKKLSNRPEESRAELANQLAQRASGMFLWVKLHQSALRRSKNQAQLREIIFHMPEGLNRTYDKNMDRIRALDRVDRARAHLVLTWVMAGDRPPTVGQIAIGFAVQRSGMSTHLHCDELPDIIDQDYINEEIINTCAGLVEVNVDSQVHSLQYQSIRFVHSSVREYLAQVITDDSMSIPFSDNHLQREFLCAILLRFLSYDCAWELPSSLTTDLQLRPFSDFATLEWIHYFPAAVSKELWNLVNDFFSPKNNRWNQWRASFEEKQICLGLLWMDDHIWDNRISLRESLPHRLLEVLCVHPRYPEASDLEIINERVRQRMDGEAYTATDPIDLFEKLKSLLNTVFLGQETNDFYPPGTRTFYAILTKNVELMRATADSNPESIDAVGGCEGSALQLGCRFAFPDMAKELIDRGANVNLQSGYNACALNAAAYGGDPSIVGMLFRAGASVNVRDSLGKDALFYALEESHTDIAMLLLQHGAEVNIRYNVLMPSGMEELTALLYAALKNNVEIFDLIIEKGADISARTDLKCNCLHLAAQSGNAEIVEKIMDRADFDLLNARDIEGYTPLCRALIFRQPEIACRLISGGAELDIPSNDGMTPLHTAVFAEQPDAVCAILESGVGVDVNARNSTGSTPLHLAAFRGCNPICQMLLDHGADLKLSTDRGYHPIHHAVIGNHVKTVDFLLDQDEGLLEAKDTAGCSPLHHAAGNDVVEMAFHLLHRGGNVNVKDSDRFTPLHYAASITDRTEMIDLLISHGADVSAPDDSGMTPILVAASNGELGNFKTLLRHGTDETTTSNTGANALHYSVLSKCAQLVYYLIERDFDANFQDDGKSTVFHYAARYGLKEILALLLDRGSCEITFNSSGESPLHYAARYGHVGCLELFLDQGLTDVINTRNPRGMTPLQLAARAGHNDVLKLLLSRFPGQIEDRTKNGNTLLSLAVQKGHASVMETLIEHGADTSALHPKGWTPLQLALRQNRLQAVKVLLKDLHKHMRLPEARLIAFSANKLRGSRSLPTLRALRRSIEVLKHPSVKKLRRSRSLSYIEKHAFTSEEGNLTTMNQSVLSN